MHEDLGEMRKLRHIWAKSWRWAAEEEMALNKKSCGQSCVVRRKEIGVRKHNSDFLSPTFLHPKCNLYDLHHKF